MEKRGADLHQTAKSACEKAWYCFVVAAGCYALTVCVQQNFIYGNLTCSQSTIEPTVNRTTKFHLCILYIKKTFSVFLIAFMIKNVYMTACAGLFADALKTKCVLLHIVYFKKKKPTQNFQNLALFFSFACWNFLSPSSFPLIFPSLSSLGLCSFSPFRSFLPPVLGISGSISFKAHVRGTVCCFQRPLCPAFLLLNLVPQNTFP